MSLKLWSFFHVPLELMVGDKGPLSLLALQKSFADQTVDGLADGDDAYAVFSRQLGALWAGGRRGAGRGLQSAIQFFCSSCA